MPITFDAKSKKYVNNATSLTQAHICAGVDRVLLVVVSSADGTDLMLTGSVTYAGVAMTPVLSSIQSANFIRLYVLASPALGTNNIVVTPSGNAYLNMAAVSFTGVDQTTPIHATNTFFDQYAVAPVSTTIVTPLGGMAVSALLQYQLTGTLTTEASQSLVDISVDLFGRLGIANKVDATDMVWTPTPDYKNATQLVVSLNPVAASGSTAAGASVTGTGSVTGGTATGGGAVTGTFTFSACENNTYSGVLNNVAVNWTWLGGSVGAITSITNGSGTITTTGMVLSGLPVGAGCGLLRTSDGTVVAYQEGTVT